jgi:HEAT repeat protein
MHGHSVELDLCVDQRPEELRVHNESRLGKNLMRYRQLFTDAAACRAARAIHTPLLFAALSFTVSGYAHQQSQVPSRFGERETRAGTTVTHGQRKTDSQEEAQDPVPALLAQLQDSDPAVKLDAIHRLAQLREKSAVEPFINLLSRDPNPDIRRAAAYGLGQLGDPRAIQPLIASLKDENPNVCMNSIFAVARIGGSERVNALMGALAHKDLHVCRAAAVGLVLLGDKSAVPPLIKSLDDNRLTVRSGAAFALGFLGDRSAVPALLRALKDDRSLVRLAAIGALGLLGDPYSVPALRQLASKDPDPQVRARAAETLNRLKTLPHKP